MPDFWSTRRGVELADSLIRNLRHIEDLTKEIRRLNDNLEKTSKEELKIENEDSLRR